MMDDFCFRLGMRDEKRPNHWRELELDHNFGKRKTILILPGSGVNEKKDANGMCKVVEKMLPSELEKEYDICSLYFPKKGERRQYSVERALMLTDYVFRPLVSECDENGYLRKISPEKAAANLRNIKIFTHCYGSYIAETLDGELANLLKRLKYTPEECRNIQKQLVIFHNNDISYNIGEKDMKSTNIIRMTQSDDKARIYEYALDSFPYYAMTENLSSEEVLYVNPSENERVLLVPKVTREGNDEHNGAYWREQGKSAAGKKEETVFNLVFTEALRADYKIENAEQFIRNALRHNYEDKELVEEILTYGKEFGDDFREYRSGIRKEFNEAGEKLLKGKLSATAVKNLSQEALLAFDNENKTLLDYAVARDDVATADSLWKRIVRVLPEENAPIEESLANLPRNYTQIKTAQKVYLQEMLDTSRPQMFKALSKGSEDLPRLDYKKADDETLLVAAEVYGRLPAMTAQLDMLYYYKSMVYMYARCERMKKNDDVEKVMKLLENRLFSKDNGKNKSSQRKIKSYAQQFKACGLLQKCQKLWPEQNGVKNLISLKKEPTLSV